MPTPESKKFAPVRQPKTDVAPGPGPVNVLEVIDATGDHPTDDGCPGRRRAPWTVDRVRSDAAAAMNLIGDALELVGAIDAALAGERAGADSRG